MKNCDVLLVERNVSSVIPEIFSPQFTELKLAMMYFL